MKLEGGKWGLPGPKLSLHAFFTALTWNKLGWVDCSYFLKGFDKDVEFIFDVTENRKTIFSVWRGVSWWRGYFRKMTVPLPLKDVFSLEKAYKWEAIDHEEFLFIGFYQVICLFPTDISSTRISFSTLKSMLCWSFFFSNIFCKFFIGVIKHWSFHTQSTNGLKGKLFLNH